MDRQAIDILILTYQRQEYLDKMIRSIQRSTSYPYRIILVDNGSDRPMVRYLKHLLEQKVIAQLVLNKKNYFMDGWQYGIPYIESDLFAISDPDILVPELTPCWLTQLVDCFELLPDLVRLGTALSMDNIPPCWNRFEARFLALRTGETVCDQPFLKQSTPDTTMQVIRTEAFSRLGGYRAQTIDFEWLKQLRTEGVCAVHQDVIVTHIGWNEYKDYPAYLYQKHKNIREYREVSLINDRINYDE